MKYIKYLIPMLIIFLTIGYAAQNITLSITGDAYIASDLGEFEVYISNIKVDDSVNLLLLENDMKIKFEVDSTQSRTEPYNIEIEFSNNSSNFDAEISKACVISNPLHTINEKNTKITTNAKNTQKMSILFDTSATVGTSENGSITCDFSATPIERQEYGEGEVPEHIRIYKIGEEISIGPEQFNVISDNGDTVTLLAKYNLHTDYLQSSASNLVKFTTSWDHDYFQDSTAELVLSEHGTIAYQYITNYTSKLSNVLAEPNIEGTLLNYDSLINLGCKSSEYTIMIRMTCTATPYTWLNNNQKTWLSMIYSEPFGNSYPYYHNTDGTVNYQSYSSTAGVRPVITLPKSSLIRDYIIIIIEDTLYRAKEGMTWKEWINSEYNTTGYNLGNCSDSDKCTNDPNGSYILDPTDSYKNLYHGGSYVYSTDIITSEFPKYDFDYYSLDILPI